MATRAKQRRQQEEREAEERERGDEAVLIALVLLLLAPLPFLVFSRRCIRLLATAGIGALATATVLAIIGPAAVKFATGEDDLAPDLEPDEGPAVATMRRNAVGRRARYILAAARRVSEGGSAKAERALFGAHLRARKGASRARGRSIGLLRNGGRSWAGLPPAIPGRRRSASHHTAGTSRHWRHPASVGRGPCTEGTAGASRWRLGLKRRCYPEHKKLPVSGFHRVRSRALTMGAMKLGVR